MTGLLLCEDRLGKAVGNYYLKVRAVKNTQVREIDKLAAESLEFREAARVANIEAENAGSGASENLEKIQALLSEAELATTKLRNVRQAVEKLASGDGRHTKSLEALKKQAEEKLEVIETVLDNANTANDRTNNALQGLIVAEERFSSTDREVLEIKQRASEVLALSSQAGLASSYLAESKKLERTSGWFTVVLYATALVSLGVAAFYVLPTLEKSVSGTHEQFSTEAAYLTLLRATVLAPLIYILYYTTKRISSLETLRMDYAEKAAASLAYSGYKGEMSEDMPLLEQLRGSLLLRFAEHPERLLRKIPGIETVQVNRKGFKARFMSGRVAKSDVEVDDVSAESDV